MKIALLGILLLLCVAAFGQNNVVTVPNATIAICQHPANAVPCTNYATTYTDSSLTVACPNNAQLTVSSATCGATSDAYGNFGFWTPAGCYDYTIVTQANVAVGPYYACFSTPTPIIYASQFTGATADVRIQAAVTSACSLGSRTVSLYGMPNLTIASNTSFGCGDGTPLQFVFDPSEKFVPGGTGVNMFTWLPGASYQGCLAASVIGVSGYSGNVLQLSGNVYDNQPGNFPASKGATVTPCLFVLGGNNTTGTAVYLEGENPATEYIEFVRFGPIYVSGMLYGVHGVTGSNGWINSNVFDYVQCTSTVHCFTPDTLDANGNFVGNSGYITIEYSANFSSNTLDGVWLKGLGEVANNQFTYYSWDFANCSTYPTCATIRVDTSLAHNFGNVFNGQLAYQFIVDSGNTLNGFDTINSYQLGTVNNITGTATYLGYNASVPGTGYGLGGHPVLTSDDTHNSILDALDSTGDVFMRTNNNRWFITPGGSASFSVSGVTKFLLDSSGNETIQGNMGVVGKLNVGSVDVISNAGVIDASKLGTGHAPAAALGTGSPSATTALYGDQSYKQTMTTTGTPVAGNTVCYVSATVLGKCTTVVSAGGTCTCASN